MRNSGDHQTGAEGLRNILLANGNHAGKGEQKLAVGKRMFRRIAQDDCWQQVGAPLIDRQAAAIAMGAAEIPSALV